MVSLPLRSRLDERIASHVASLSRALTAADAAQAAVVCLDDHSLRSVDSSVQTLELLSEEIVTEHHLLSAGPAPARDETSAAG